MIDPVWVPLSAIIIIHDRQISRHGGAGGLRDRALLEVGCGRPVNLYAYKSDVTLEELAAAYAYGITKAHAFVDGNKRTGFVTALTFLRLNKRFFRPEPVEGVRMMENLAADLATEADFALWAKRGARPLGCSG